jgi:hypothetical protein
VKSNEAKSNEKYLTLYVSRFTLYGLKRKGAKGLDGGYEDQVACRGSVTT